MYTYEKILEDIRGLGVGEDDVLLVHSSMKAIGDVSGGAETVIDALMASVKKGMLVMPTHTWATMTEEDSIYNCEKEAACVGIIPNLFMKRQGVLRSLHPTHSVAAYGKMAEEYICGEENRTTPCSRSGCYGKLYDRNAKILLLGCGLNRNTYMHGIEEWFGIQERLTNHSYSFNIIMPDGTIKKSLMRKHYKPDGISISEYYVKMESPLIHKGIMKLGNIGNARCMIMNAKETADIFTKYLSKNRDVFTDYSSIPSEWY